MTPLKVFFKDPSYAAPKTVFLLVLVSAIGWFAYQNSNPNNTNESKVINPAATASQQKTCVAGAWTFTDNLGALQCDHVNGLCVHEITPGACPVKSSALTPAGGAVNTPVEGHGIVNQSGTAQ